MQIEEQRRRSARVLRQNPSLKACLDEIFQDAYGDARLIAARETGKDKAEFPQESPWTANQVLEEDFLPGEGCRLAVEAGGQWKGR